MFSGHRVVGFLRGLVGFVVLIEDLLRGPIPKRGFDVLRNCVHCMRAGRRLLTIDQLDSWSPRSSTPTNYYHNKYQSGPPTHEYQAFSRVFASSCRRIIRPTGVSFDPRPEREHHTLEQDHGPGRHPDRVLDQAGVRSLPAIAHPIISRGETIDHQRQVHPPLPGPDVGDVPDQLHPRARSR